MAAAVAAVAAAAAVAVCSGPAAECVVEEVKQKTRALDGEASLGEAGAAALLSPAEQNHVFHTSFISY